MASNETHRDNPNATNSGKETTGETHRDEVYVISVAAELTGLHAQTLRTYDRMGLVTPGRTRGGGRRYSSDDIEMLREIQRLSHEDGVNLAGIRAIIELKSQVDELQQENYRLREQLARMEARPSRSRGEIVHVPRSTAVVMWEPGARRRKDRHNGR
ncbi:heat shock protein transcriptional repressor HspR [Corynebacterium kroppenstedtii]|uniref:heat shock protein transcriptional repressor HspR n=1 Tax=Corynebacterium sp. PCR 32 TaxID=3351342 RepID=UPI003094C815